jgi:hypothetical protein
MNREIHVRFCESLGASVLVLGDVAFILCIRGMCLILQPHFSQ